jgi:aquaporin Z
MPAAQLKGSALPAADPGGQRSTRQRIKRLHLKGHPDDLPAPQPKATGWHVVDWLCELAGTCFQLLIGFGVVALFEAPESSLSAALPGWARLIIIGTAFGVLAAVVALSPPGRRSGAHLNPAVTLGFFLRRHTSGRDLAGYALAQVVGALGAALAFRAAWGPWAAGVHGARTQPERGLASWAVVGIEAAITCGLLTVVFVMLSSGRTARWTPAAVTGALAGLIWAAAPHTGASMNPARSLGPDLATGAFPLLWAYFAGPVVGAALAAGAFSWFTTERRTLTAKLFHDPDYPSVHATELPARPHRSSNQSRPADPPSAGRDLPDTREAGSRRRPRDR